MPVDGTPDTIFDKDRNLLTTFSSSRYTITGESWERKFFLIHGGGMNGKSVKIDVIHHILGKYSTTVSFDIITRHGSSQKNYDAEILHLLGVRMASASEVIENATFHEGRIKSFTGGRDEITVRGLYQKEPTSFRVRAKIWMAVNHLPNATDTTKSFWDRAMVIPFMHNFKENNIDQKIYDSLILERHGILTWAVQGAIKYYKDGIGSCQAVRNMSALYKDTEDSLGAFMEEECEVLNPENQSDEEMWTRASDLLIAFNRWNEERGGRKMSVKMLSQRWMDHGVAKRKRYGGSEYAVKLKNAPVPEYDQGKFGNF